MRHTTLPPAPSRLGRMARWHKNTMYVVLLACLASGWTWFILGELVELMPPQLRFWWVTHGLAGLLTFFVIGSAVSQHVLVTWRSRRNRLAGAMTTMIFALITLSTAMLYYGNDFARDIAKWTHIGLGIILCLFFPWHILKGKKSTPQLRQ
jgi:hypothetical protein